ncbi:transposase [Cohnella phaseoli]|uniref:Transposase-like zinc ribbon protein n=1 Tax=Cohnella phaseoli TaxID=456490 RepID=A0A3D9KC07_9BACL|nr:transposase [Cohnella phaseoli]RED84064.1 transposase-like zinc ribbon protein [Cohnella phaseoli]
MASIRKFMALFPDEQSCRNHLFAVRWPRGFICTKCGEMRYCLIKTRNVYECANCKTQTSITSNTLMHRTKLPLRYWMVALYWVASGQRCSARRLARTLQIQQRTAERLLLKIRHAMHRSERTPMLDFWNREKRTAQQPIVRRALLMLYRKSRTFIRKYYGRRVSKWNRLYYYYEYRFRSNNAHNAVAALSKLIISACTTIYSLNEYGMLRENKKQPPNQTVQGRCFQ